MGPASQPPVHHGLPGGLQGPHHQGGEGQPLLQGSGRGRKEGVRGQTGIPQRNRHRGITFINFLNFIDELNRKFSQKNSKYFPVNMGPYFCMRI